jgi:hypothetical protein
MRRKKGKQKYENEEENRRETRRNNGRYTAAGFLPGARQSYPRIIDTKPLVGVFISSKIEIVQCVVPFPNVYPLSPPIQPVLAAVLIR